MWPCSTIHTVSPHVAPPQLPRISAPGTLKHPSYMIPTLYAATTNAGKLRDFAFASNDEVTILPLPGLAHMPEPFEDADTFEGNARLKAIVYSRHAPDKIVLADDSGIEVDALGGAPGVHSARYAADMAFTSSSFTNRDDLNMECLLAHAADLSGVCRRARYRCVLAAAHDGEVLTTSYGAVEGLLIDAPRGRGGFGYDPIFLIETLGLTMAELSPEDRLAHSHRARALADLLPRLRWRF